MTSPQLDVTAELLRQATMALDLAQGRYNLGLSSIVELTQAQLNLTEAEVESLGPSTSSRNRMRCCGIPRECCGEADFRGV
jgi:hypothetical protein